MNSHVHYDMSGGQHQHSHSHDGDADHGHDHEEIDAAVRSAEAAKRTGQARRRLTVLNSAQRAAQDDSWSRLARTAAELERERGR